MRKFNILPLLALALLPCTQLSYSAVAPTAPRNPLQQGPPQGDAALPQIPEGFDPNQVQLPSSQEEIEQAMQEMQALDPEQLKQFERAGQHIIYNMSDEDLQEFAQAFGIDPDELREEARKGIEEQEAEASQYQDSTPQQPTPQQQKEEADTTTKTATKEQSTSPQAAERVIKEGVELLAQLRRAVASQEELYRHMHNWMLEIRDLAFYLNVIDTHNHHTRLGNKEYENLLTSLSQLVGTLKKHVAEITHKKEQEEDLDDPFAILGVPHTASQERIEMAYQELKNTYDPEKTRAQAQKEGLSKQDIERRVRAQRLAFESVQDAYEELSDPALKQQLVKDRTAKKEQKENELVRLKEHGNAIIQALSSAIYDARIIGSLERFLQDYAPEKLKIKQKLEKAENDHKKRLQYQARKEPEQTRTPRLEPSVSFQGRDMFDNDYGFFDTYDMPFGGLDDFMDDYGFPGNTQPFDDFANSDERQPQQQQQGSSNESTSKDDQQKEQMKDKKGKTKADVTSQETPENVQELRKLGKNLDNHFSAFHNTYSELEKELTSAKAAQKIEENQAKRLSEAITKSHLQGMNADLNNIVDILRRQDAKPTKEQRNIVSDVLKETPEKELTKQKLETIKNLTNQVRQRDGAPQEVKTTHQRVANALNAYTTLADTLRPAPKQKSEDASEKEDLQEQTPTQEQQKTQPQSETTSESSSSQKSDQNE